jgi:hypothetical protein
MEINYELQSWTLCPVIDQYRTIILLPDSKNYWFVKQKDCSLGLWFGLVACNVLSWVLAVVAVSLVTGAPTVYDVPTATVVSTVPGDGIPLCSSCQHLQCAVDPAVTDVLTAFDVLGLSAVAAVPSADVVSNVSGVPSIAGIPAVVGVPGFAGVPAIANVPAVVNVPAFAVL